MKFWIDTLFEYKLSFGLLVITILILLVMLILSVKSDLKSDKKGFAKIYPDTFWLFIALVGFIVFTIYISGTPRKIYDLAWQGKVVKVYTYERSYMTRSGRKYDHRYAVDLKNHKNEYFDLDYDVWKKVKKGDFVFKEKGSYKVKIRK